MSIKMTALDHFFGNDVRQVVAGTVFSVETTERAQELVDRGLAQPVEEPAKPEAQPKGKKAK